MQISKKQYDKLPKRLQEHFQLGNAHPTAKNIKLMSWLITLASREGDIVLDPFCGSGTTAIAAKMLGRQYIGIEKEEDYCKIARKRIAAVPTRLDSYNML
jgi:DNA modification methylase